MDRCPNCGWKSTNLRRKQRDRAIEFLTEFSKMWKSKPLDKDTLKALFKALQLRGIYSQKTVFCDVKMPQLLEEAKFRLKRMVSID